MDDKELCFWQEEQNIKIWVYLVNRNYVAKYPIPYK